MKKNIGLAKNIQTTNIEKVTGVLYAFVVKDAPHKAIVVSDKAGNYQVFTVDFEKNISYQITNAKQGAIFGSLSPDGSYVYSLVDDTGAERGHFARMNFDGSNKTNLTPTLTPYYSYGVNVSADNSTHCFAASQKNKDSIFVTKINANGSSVSRKVYSTNLSISDPLISSDAKYVYFVEKSKDGSKSYLITLDITKKSLTKKISKAFNTFILLDIFDNEGESIALALTYKGQQTLPALYNLKTKKLQILTHKNFKGDVWVNKWDATNSEMIICDVHAGTQKLYLYNYKQNTLKRIGPTTGSFNIHYNSVITLKDGSLIMKWSDFSHSSRLIKIDTNKKSDWSTYHFGLREYSSSIALENKSCVSTDGQKVQMWITAPPKTKKPIPFIIDIHGGPHDVIFDSFDQVSQQLLQKGFGYCAVNYRGSISFGKKYEEKIYGNPGHWEVEDVVAARNWLVKNKYTTENGVILQGWSWGGFVTLLAAVRYPKLWKAAVAGSGIADWKMEYEDEPAYFKSQEVMLFKGTPKTALSRYKRSSPIEYAQNLQTPLLILHGKNDSRCPARQMKHFISKLKAEKKKFEVMWYNSGHLGNFTDKKLQAKLTHATIKFLKNKL